MQSGEERDNGVVGVRGRSTRQSGKVCGTKSAVCLVCHVYAVFGVGMLYLGGRREETDGGGGGRHAA